MLHLENESGHAVTSEWSWEKDTEDSFK